MTGECFQQQIGRLERQFGKYGTERCTLLWREVKDFSEKWLEESVDSFISSSRHTPLLIDFSEKISAERERLWRVEKEKNAKEAKEFYHGSYKPDDVRTICQYIIKRIMSGVSDLDFSKFIEHLVDTAKSMFKQKVPQCSQCGEDGLIFHREENGYEYVYRCTCEQGQKRPNSYPVYQRS